VLFGLTLAPIIAALACAAVGAVLLIGRSEVDPV
jgi:hypothetical protein